MYSESLGQQVQEERIVFGLIADRTANHTLTELVNTYQYSSYDVSTIAREVSVFISTTTVCVHFVRIMKISLLHVHAYSY